MAQDKFSKITMMLLTAFLLALPSNVQATEDYNGFGEAPFANQNHPGFGESPSTTTPVNALAGAGEMGQTNGNELAATDDAAAALSEIAPAAGTESVISADEDIKGWATNWPESLVEIENEFAPVKKENSAPLTPPTF